uniref:Lipase domain-containing protein n=1 Tax=Daphnia galeata TaxID=27404 RepID=A0A8J2WJB2_9CRUS|nr:unnamed protein product [Daphnia galeata]
MDIGNILNWVIIRESTVDDLHFKKERNGRSESNGVKPNNEDDVVQYSLVSYLLVVPWCYHADLCSEALADPFASLKTGFLLWTRRNPVLFQPLLIGNAAILALSNYVPSNPTIIYAHGWTESFRDDLSIRMRDSFLQREDCNFIAVDWQLLAMPPLYPKSVANVRPVGILTGNLVDFLISQGANRLRFHLLGFSLGAHIVGRAGSTATNRIPRITGLDPAFPCFEKAGADRILERSDATFVDIIHTNAGFLIEKRLGFPFSIGHADFWPNGGSIQPGCDPVNIATQSTTVGNIASLFVQAVACNHRRAVEYFIESINGAIPFTATQCNSYAEFNTGVCANNFRTFMGLPVSTLANGNFYLNTNPRPPFAQG